MLLFIPGQLHWPGINKIKAESEGFEPPVPRSRTTDFESAPINHSGNSPV